MEYLRGIEWKPLWGIPAIFAGVIMIVFALLFRDRGDSDAAEASEGDSPAPHVEAAARAW